MALVFTLGALAALAASAGMWVLAKVLFAWIVLYAVIAAALLVLVRRPPGRIVSILWKMPRLVLRPFRGVMRMARGGALRPGSVAPDFDLETADKLSRVRLSSFCGHKPVVLTFVGDARPSVERSFDLLNQLYRNYRDEVAFFTVYVGPAKVAGQADPMLGPASESHSKIPVLVDDPGDTAEAAYKGWPRRLYLIDRQGRVAFVSPPRRPRELLPLLQAMVPGRDL